MRIALLLLLCLITLPAMAQDTLPYTDGVPLMEEFTISNDDVMVFDKPEGRLVDIVAWCAAQCPQNSEINAFYNRSMTRLGWAKSGNDPVFTNNEQALSYKIIRDNDNNSVILVFQSNG